MYNATKVYQKYFQQGEAMIHRIWRALKKGLNQYKHFYNLKTIINYIYIITIEMEMFMTTSKNIIRRIA